MELRIGTIIAVAVCFATAAEAVDVRQMWDIFTDFGPFDGAVRQTERGFVADGNGISVETEENTGEAGVTHRRTIVSNLSEKPIDVTCLLDVFRFEGGDFEVYTQANTWMNESRGKWQQLQTGVEARGAGMRTAYGAAPVLALWNAQTRRGRVFHLMSDAKWEMRAAMMPGAVEKSHVVVQVGMDSRHLRYKLNKGESIALPEVVYYDFTNKTDLDCHKLHAWWNVTYPSKRNPSIYNTWLSRFDKLDADFVLKQVKRAATLGLEYFVIDAGWFGPKGDWGSTRGDWKERPDGRLEGRLMEIAQAVKAAGMKFGLWIEAEAAAETSEVMKRYPEFFCTRNGAKFFDFTREDARAHLHAAIDDLVKKYGIGFIKFDFNCEAHIDDTGKNFSDYNAAYRKFLREVRARHPGIYLGGCASGGLMMDLGWARDFDSFWLSDNQSPIYAMRIAKETMLRLPPQKIERWITARSATGLQPDYSGNDERLIATEDAYWREMRSVAPDFVSAFATGGPVGFSCDLTAFSDEHLDYFRRMVAERKKDEAFWCTATGRILCDTPEVVVLQYSDKALKDVRVIVATDRSRQNSTTVYPVLDPSLDYEYKGRIEKGAFWMAQGVVVELTFGDAVEVRFVQAPGKGVMPDVDSIELEGDYEGHLQDVWQDGRTLYWAHTQSMVKTDLSGTILAKNDVGGHHAGLAVKDGRVYVAVCEMHDTTGDKALPESYVTVNVYDAGTLKLLEEHVTDVNDRAGALAVLEDGTFMVGCLRPQDIALAQVRFHHLDRNFKLMKSHVLDNVRVPLGIETIKQQNGCFYLSFYTHDALSLGRRVRDSLCIKLDRDFNEISRHSVNGACGLVFDGDYVWVGLTWADEKSKRYRSSLKRIERPSGF